ncbi:lysosomal alpha-mannosidase-like isoform X2 [Danaus plexippus]|nr:lysosomal alpha-mannosidase-like isoform X2 [Danaus plexippus]
MLLLFLLIGLSSGVPLDEKCGYDSCTAAEAGVLNVHIVPHTHDDVGWLKTVDQYYYGSKNDIQKAGVQYILDSVIKELWQDPKRRFIYVETAFFWKWWTLQSDDTRHKVHTLVRQGRLQFVGGAWSMNDEAASHYQSTIDQFTWGLKKLNDTFGACGIPRVGWQIDPFGHSREFASLLSQMGYDGLFLGRIDYQDKGSRLRDKRMEMVWRGDDQLGNSSDIFTGVLFNTYSPPAGFCFDVLCNDEPIIDDVNSPLYNVEDRVNKFLAVCRNMSEAYGTDNVLVTMGEDFQYQDASMWFINLDKLIQYTNLKAAKDGLNIKLFYSTPDCYLKAVKDSNPTLPTKQDDFFPYASDPTAYWTGYFTSRPTTKYFERLGNRYLQMVKNLQVLAGLEEHNKFVIDELKSAMGVMQHHDAITGTEKQHVAHDYERLLDNAVEDALLVARQGISKLSKSEKYQFNYERCRLNESSCATSEDSQQFVVTVYNPLGWNTLEPIRIPVLDGEYEVYAPNGEKVTSQLLDIPNPVRKIPTRKSGATHELTFIAKLHPLSIKSFFIKKMQRTRRGIDYRSIKNYWSNIGSPYIVENIDYVDNIGTDKIVVPSHVSGTGSNINFDVLTDEDLNVGRAENMRNRDKVPRNMEKMRHPSLTDEEYRLLADEPSVVQRSEEYYLENEFLKLRSDDTGVTHMILPDRTTNLRIQFHYWTGCSGDNTNTTTRSSGAYIFRPETDKPYPLEYNSNRIVKGEVVQEIRAESDTASSTFRVYGGLPFIEHDFVVGPIPVDDKVGKEYVIRYDTNVGNDGVFFTDSNGRQVLKRKLNERPQWNLTLAEPIAGNYYPVTSKMFLEDGHTRITVLVDRSEGGTSLVQGGIELMVHRRLLHDDAFGVGEALNEVAQGEGLVVRGRHRLLNLNPNDEQETLSEKKYALQTHYEPIVFVSKAEHISFESWLKLSNCFKGMKQLPDGVHLLTLETWRDKILLRFENYIDRAVQVDFNIFNTIKIKSVKETTLAANQWLEDHTKWNWNIEGEFQNSDSQPNPIPDDLTDLKCTLKAKQIRTFVADYELNA